LSLTISCNCHQPPFLPSYNKSNNGSPSSRSSRSTITLINTTQNTSTCQYHCHSPVQHLHQSSSPITTFDHQIAAWLYHCTTLSHQRPSANRHHHSPISGAIHRSAGQLATANCHRQFSHQFHHRQRPSSLSSPLTTISSSAFHHLLHFPSASPFHHQPAVAHHHHCTTSHISWVRPVASSAVIPSSTIIKATVITNCQPYQNTIQSSFTTTIVRVFRSFNNHHWLNGQIITTNSTISAHSIRHQPHKSSPITTTNSQPVNTGHASSPPM